MGPDPGRRNQNEEPSGLTLETLGISHMPSLCPGWCLALGGRPGPSGAQAAVLGTESSWSPHCGHLESPGRHQDSSGPSRLWEGAGGTSAKAQCPPLLEPKCWLLPSIAPLPAAPLSSQNLSLQMGHPFTSPHPRGFCITFTVKNSHPLSLSHPPTASVSCAHSEGGSQLQTQHPRQAVLYQAWDNLGRKHLTLEV